PRPPDTPRAHHPPPAYPPPRAVPVERTPPRVHPSSLARHRFCSRSPARANRSAPPPPSPATTTPRPHLRHATCDHFYHHEFRVSHSRRARPIAVSRRDMTPEMFCAFIRTLIASLNRFTLNSQPRPSQREVNCQAL